MLKNYPKIVIFSALFLLFFTNNTFANEVEIRKSIQHSKDAYIVLSEAVFEFIEGAQYQINTKPGYVTDIILGDGEEITYIGGGETVRWVFDVNKTGDTYHVYVRPTKEGIDTNLIINTDRRTYRILLISTNWYNPAVRWNFPLDEQQKQNFENNLYIEKNSRTFITSVDTLNFNYKCKANSKEARSFIPQQVFDDGLKTYIKLPSSVNTSNYPVLYVMEGKNTSLVNYRTKDDFIIVDLLFDSAQLVVDKQIIIIKNLQKSRNTPKSR